MKTRRWYALLGLALVGALLGVSAGQSVLADPSSPTGHISNVKSKPGEVDFTLTVTGLAGAKVDTGSVTVSTDGRVFDSSVGRSEVLQSSQPGVEREVILVLDLSGSMKGAGIQAARAAGNAYAKQLPADVRIGLITFSDRPTTVLQPTTNRTALATALANAQPGGRTGLYDGIAAGLNLVRSLPTTSLRRLLVLSDGKDTSSSRSLTDLLATLRTDKVPADVVAFRLPGSQVVLDQIAASSGGSVLPATDAGGLARAFANAARAFGQRVHVAVKVPADADKGRFNLTVKVAAAGRTVVTQTTANLIPADGSSASDGSSSSVSLHDKGLLAILALAFLSALALALVLLLVPVLRHERSAWEARVAEAGRYRVVRSVGQESDGFESQETEGPVAQRALSFVDRAVRARGQRERLISELERAGMRMRPEEWAILQLATVLAFAAVAFVLFRSAIGVPIGGILGWLACRLFIRIKIDKRAKAFEQQLPDNLQLLAGSLRSGFSLAQALGTVVREGTEPSASEYTRALTEVRLGAELEGALERVADRMRCEDLRWVVMTIRISREVGGNLAEVLDNTVETMRERARLRGQVRVLTAEGRLSARILTALPIFVGTIFVLIRPTYVHPLFHSRTGLIMFAIGVLELCLGAFWLNRLTKIEM